MEKFFPIPSNITKYITIQNSSGMSAKNYSYWQEIVDIIFPLLEKNNIKILSIGDKDSKPLQKVINLIGQTSIHQATYIVNRSLLHIGNDSFLGHVSCANNIPTIILYGPTTVENHSPYFYNPETSIFIESHRNGNKATFAREESPKTIDLILPEDVAISICKLLNIEYNYQYKTINIGKFYENKLIESDCSNPINISKLNIPNIICRLDYNFNLAVLIEQLKIGKVSIVTNKEIPINLLLDFKHNVADITIEITKRTDINFVKKIHENKFNYRLYSFLNDEYLNSIKLDYVDYEPIIKKFINMPEFFENIDKNNLYYKSSKITLGRGGKIYHSKWAYVNDKPLDSFESVPQKIDGSFGFDTILNELDYLILLKKLT